MRNAMPTGEKDPAQWSPMSNQKDYDDMVELMETDGQLAVFKYGDPGIILRRAGNAIGFCLFSLGVRNNEKDELLTIK